MILVPRAELLAWAKAWQDEHDPNDGADCVTPFDAYLLKPPVNAQSTVHVEVLRHMKGTIKAIMQSEVAALDAAIAALSAPQPPVEAHCATCSCVPGMTPAVRFDATPAEKEGAVRDHLIRMGWTPPAEAQPVGKVSRDTGLTVTLERLPYYTGTRLAKGTELYAHPPPPPSAPVGVEVLKIIDKWMKNYDHMGTGSNTDARESEEEWEEDRVKLISILAQQPAAVGEVATLRGLLDEVRSHFTRDDDLPDDLLPRIDAALAASKAEAGGGEAVACWRVHRIHGATGEWVPATGWMDGGPSADDLTQLPDDKRWRMEFAYTAPPASGAVPEVIESGCQIVEEFIQCSQVGRPPGKLVEQAKDWLAAAKKEGE